MKKLLFIMAVFLPLAVVGQSDLYRQYAKRSDLTVAQVVGFRLNDSVKVDVLIIQADDNQAWKKLKKEFDIRTDAGVSSWLGELNNPERRVRWTGKPCCKVISLHEKKTLSIYSIAGKREYEALLEYQLSKMEE